MKTIYTKYMMIGLLVSMPLFGMEQQANDPEIARATLVQGSEMQSFVQYAQDASRKAQEVVGQAQEIIAFIERHCNSFVGKRKTDAESIKAFACSAIENASLVQHYAANSQECIDKSAQDVSQMWETFKTDYISEIAKALKDAHRDLSIALAGKKIFLQQNKKLSAKIQDEKNSEVKTAKRRILVETEAEKSISEQRKRQAFEILELEKSLARNVQEAARKEIAMQESEHVQELARQERIELVMQAEARRQLAEINRLETARFERVLQQEDVLHAQALINHNEALRTHTVAQQSGNRNSDFLPDLEKVAPGMVGEDIELVVLPAPLPAVLVPAEQQLQWLDNRPDTFNERRLEQLPLVETKMHKALRFGTITAGAVATIATAIIVQRLSKYWGYSVIPAIFGSAVTYLTHRWIAKKA